MDVVTKNYKAEVNVLRPHNEREHLEEVGDGWYGRKSQKEGSPRDEVD